MSEKISTDASELKKAEDALRITEGRYRRLVESLERDYIIYSHDVSGRFTYLSPSIVNVLGYSPEDFMGHYAEYMTDSPLNRAAEGCTDAALNGEKQEPYEAEFWHKNGDRVRLRVTEVPVFDDNGRVQSIEGIVQDITELRQAEDERERLIRKLKKALSAVKTLSGLLPICARCKRIKDDTGRWRQVESYVKDHSDAEFTHGYCPECYRRELEKIEQEGSPGL